MLAIQSTPNMSSAANEVWQLNDASARLTLDSLQAEVRSECPSEGIGQLQFANESLAEVRILRWQPDANDPRPLTFADAYLRGRDLVATYAAVPPDQVQPQIYWRAVEEPAFGAAGVELIVSVQTSLLDSRPQSAATSEIGLGEIWQLLDPIEGSFAYLALDSQPLIFDDATQLAPSLLVIRPADAQYSYAEMIHPTDFFSVALEQDPTNPAPCGLLRNCFLNGWKRV